MESFRSSYFVTKQQKTGTERFRSTWLFNQTLPKKAHTEPEREEDDMTWWKGGKNPPSTNTGAPDKHDTHVRVLGSKALVAMHVYTVKINYILACMISRCRRSKCRRREEGTFTEQRPACLSASLTEAVAELYPRYSCSLQLYHMRPCRSAA